MFYRNTEITEKTVISLPVALKTMNDISIVMTLSEIPTKRCGLYSITQQRTLGVDGNGHLCYWFYDGSNDRCLNGATVLSGTDVKVGVVHSRKGVRLYVNGNLDAFCEAPLWSENCNNSYIGTHGLAPSDLEMDGEIGGVLLVDYAMSDEEMFAVNWNSELYVVNNHLYYAPSKTTLHLDDSLASSFSDGSMYALEDSGSIVISDEEKLPCWYLGEYNSTTQDITLNISDKRGGGTYNRMEVDHLMVHDIDVADTNHVVEADGEDVYPYLAINEYNNAIFTNPHIDTMKVEYHCSEDPVSESDLDTITVWGSSYDDTFPYIYAKYTIAYKDGASGIIVTTVRDPNHEQYMVRTVTCYVETTASTYTWPTDPTLFDSGTSLSFFDRNAHAGKYQFTRQWTWFGEGWSATDHDTVPTSSIEGFTSGHWVSGSETALFVVDDDYLRNIVVVEDVVSQSVKDYAEAQSKPVSSYMGKKMLPSGISSGYALSDSSGSLQAKDCYLEEVHADGFMTSSLLSREAWNLVQIESATQLYYLGSYFTNTACMRDLYKVEGSIGPYVSYSRQMFGLWDNHTDPPTFCTDSFHEVQVNNWFMSDRAMTNYHFFRFLLHLNDSYSSTSESTLNTLCEEMFGRLGIQVVYNGHTYIIHNDSSQWYHVKITPKSGDVLVGVQYRHLSILKDGSQVGIMNTATISATSQSETIRIRTDFSELSDITVGTANFALYDYADGGTTLYPFGIVMVRNKKVDSSFYTDGLTFEGCLPSGGTVYGTLENIYRQCSCSASFVGGVGSGTQKVTVSYKNPSTFNATTINCGSLNSSLSTVFPMRIQTWTSIRGESYMRALLPFGNSDTYVMQNGSTIGSSSSVWETVFTRSIRDGSAVVLRPFKADDTNQTTMLLYDKYMMVWGTDVTDSEGKAKIKFEKTFSDSSYTVITSMNVISKGQFSITVNGSANAMFGWIAIGKRYN